MGGYDIMLMLMESCYQSSKPLCGRFPLPRKQEQQPLSRALPELAVRPATHAGKLRAYYFAQEEQPARASAHLADAK